MVPVGMGQVFLNFTHEQYKPLDINVTNYFVVTSRMI